jgi:hypothetical protein
MHNKGWEIICTLEEIYDRIGEMGTKDIKLYCNYNTAVDGIPCSHPISTALFPA